ncbi:ribosomal protein L22/L17 [Lipomyces japonicus]|uniref:mitochondrial 54S ribosomal protein uL22m n=1 Tax=Lipomyces japonicus TaxID=56871 RepID=UPI0034CED557
MSMERARLAELEQKRELSEDEKERAKIDREIEESLGNFQEEYKSTSSTTPTGAVVNKPEDDQALQEIIRPKPQTAVDLLLGPLQKAVYLKQTTGEENPLITGREFKLNLSKRDLELLEPSIRLKSQTQTGSVKKVTPLLRSLRRMNVKRAIAHCHFNTKKVSKPIEDLLLKGLEHAKALGIPEEGLYIEQIWSGKEPKPITTHSKQIHYRGRGRSGLFKRREHHVQIILRTPVTKERIAREKARKVSKRKPFIQLPNTPFYDKSSSHYTW